MHKINFTKFKKIFKNLKNRNNSINKSQLENDSEVKIITKGIFEQPEEDATEPPKWFIELIDNIENNIDQNIVKLYNNVESKIKESIIKVSNNVENKIREETIEWFNNFENKINKQIAEWSNILGNKKLIN